MQRIIFCGGRFDGGHEVVERLDTRQVSLQHSPHFFVVAPQQGAVDRGPVRKILVQRSDDHIRAPRNFGHGYAVRPFLDDQRCCRVEDAFHRGFRPRLSGTAPAGRFTGCHGDFTAPLSCVFKRECLSNLQLAQIPSREPLMTGTAIITGGAGGIAGELAPLLLKRGFQLVLLDRDERRLSERAQALGGAVRCVTVDLTDPRDLDHAATLIADTPNLALLVNNAGIIEPGDVADLPYATMKRHIDINLLAPMRLTQAAIGRMIDRRGGCILSIVSAAGVVSLPGSAAYSASKFGLRGFLTSLSQEVVRHGVKVRNVFPGAVDTPMLRYEATHGGSPLNFLNKEVLSPAQVAAACMRAMDGKSLETYLPFSDGITARIVGMAPGLIPLVLPRLQKKGESGMQRYLSSRGLKPGG